MFAVSLGSYAVSLDFRGIPQNLKEHIVRAYSLICIFLSLSEFSLRSVKFETLH